ncbi:MAG: aldo/keto reductase [Pseudonocardiaceae bacterium]|nr:aldo/keto reductase [Pseudonocardiaceae bacterium]
MGNVPSITLNNGVQIPQLGFGVWQVPPEETAPAVEHALRSGYRSIDTAAAYGNEEGVGEAIKNSGLGRDELFVTTKLWNAHHGYDETLRAFDDSMGKLGLDHLDLYLIHWALPKRDRYVDTWKAFEKLHADGRIRAIGVSNFHAAHLQRLFDETEIVPAVNQIELHPNLPQAELRAFHARHNIATEAWSPLAQGGLVKDPSLAGLAEKYGKTPAQVVLRWHIQLGNIVIPKSVTPSRIEENIDVFDFELADDDLAAIDALENNGRVGPNPDTFDYVG